MKIFGLQTNHQILQLNRNFDKLASGEAVQSLSKVFITRNLWK